MKLKHSFQHDGKTIDCVEFIRRPKVKDRIFAARLAKEIFGETEGESILLGILSQICVFGKEKIRIAADILAESLDYEDFMSIFEEMPGTDFFAGRKPDLDESTVSYSQTDNQQEI